METPKLVKEEEEMLQALEQRWRLYVLVKDHGGAGGCA